jgi:hypothetical protein
MSVIQYLKESFQDVNTTQRINILLKENEDMNTLDPKFITRLINYIDKLFPSYGNLDHNISIELKSIMDNKDTKDIQKVKKKIHNILMKCKSKLLTRVKDQVEKISIGPKQNEEPKEETNVDPTIS